MNFDVDTKKMKGNPKTPNELEESDDTEVAVTIEQSRMHIGPIPSPHVLAEYNEIDPSFANRIVVMAENQSSHRQEMEKRIVKSSIRDSSWGIICGFTIGMTALLIALVLGLNGRTIACSVIGGGGLVGLVSVFISGTRYKDREDNKND